MYLQITTLNFHEGCYYTVPINEDVNGLSLPDGVKVSFSPHEAVIEYSRTSLSQKA